MRDVAIVSFAQSALVRRETRDDVEMLVPVITEAVEQSGIPRKKIGFTVSGSSDYLIGRPFSFVGALDAAGPWPPIEESHVEMDGAFAFYEAWMRLQHGDIDSALVFCFGRSSLGDIADVLNAQLDPYVVGPLGVDAISLAALQARRVLEAPLRKAGGTTVTERDFAEVAVRNRRSALGNPAAQVRGSPDAEVLLQESYVASPLRRHDCPPVTDGAAAMVLAAGDLAEAASRRPVWVRGIDQRISSQAMGVLPLTVSGTSARGARDGADRMAGFSDVDIAELHAPFSYQELILRADLRLGQEVVVNPSGGALAANPVMVAGLIRVGEAAKQISEGKARRALAHATSGPCLQHNLVCLLEGGV
jgi:acetyl-CoA acetyltransferase